MHAILPREMVTLRFSVLLTLVFFGFSGALPAAWLDEAIDSVMDTDPVVPQARLVRTFSPRLLGLWLQALQRPEHDLQCQAAAAIGLAHRRGMAGLDAAVAPLVKTLDAPEQHPAVRLAAAQALVALDARSAAASLFQQARTAGSEMRHVVEPVLARWDYEPMRAVWLARLNQSESSGPSRILAAQGLGMVREPKAVPRLRELVLAPATEAVLRLEAARALGAMQSTGLEPDAEALAAEKGEATNVAPIAAAAVLRNHRSATAVAILQRLAVDAEPPAAVAALEGLLANDPRQVLPVLGQIVRSPDAAVRRYGPLAQQRCRVPEQIPALAALLDDAHPQVRIETRKSLFATAQPAGQRDRVIAATAGPLAGTQWQALEQAILLLTQLDHKPAATRFVELLRHERPEVYVSAAWGLRKLAVPATLPAQLRAIEQRWQQSLRRVSTEPYEMIDIQVAQLAQSLGQARYRPAAAVLHRFIAKPATIGGTSRAAAIWALSGIYRESPPDDLVDALIDRVNDDSSENPEDPGVRRMAAIALGRMKAQAAAKDLGRYYPGKLTTEPFRNACGWALHAITGAPLPAGTVEIPQRGWFLDAND